MLHNNIIINIYYYYYYLRANFSNRHNLELSMAGRHLYIKYIYALFDLGTLDDAG